MLTCGHVNLLISVLLVVHLSLIGQLGQRQMMPRHHHRNAQIKMRPDNNEKLSSQPLADSVAQTVAESRTIKTDSMEPRIPVAARSLLTILKHQLRDLISESLNTVQSHDVLSTTQAQARVLIALKRGNVSVGEPPDEGYIDEEAWNLPYLYGDIYNITLKQPAGLHDVIVATMTIGVCCGRDTSFYLFQKRGACWVLTLTQEANGYAQIDGAQGMFDCRIAPLDHAGHLFVVTTNVNPWCTSNWQRLRYCVMRIGARPEKPQVLKRSAETIYLGVDIPYQLRAAQGNFSLDFEGDSNPDEIHCRHHLTYRINSTGAHLLRKD